VKFLARTSRLWLFALLGFGVLGAVVGWACGRSSSSAPSSNTPGAPSASTVTSVTVTGTPPAVGGTSQFTATAALSNGTTQDVTSQAVWDSSNPSVATVVAGRVTGVAPGEVDITATYQGVSGRTRITIGRNTFTISGRVTDGTSGGVLPNIDITLADGPSAGLSARTNRSGEYSIAGVQPGTTTVVASAPSYQTVRKTVTVTSDMRVDFVLPRATSAPPPAGPAQCDASLWNHVHDVSRLQIVSSCLTVTGVVAARHSNDDGDVDMQVAVDPQFANLLNRGNLTKLNGHLQTEAVCQAPVHPSIPDAVRACRNFVGTVTLAPVGASVQVTGTYTLDRDHGWMEIHPISVLVVR
jgi:hypothetical protein